MIVGQCVSQKIFTPSRYEVDDDQHHDAVDGQRQHNIPQGAPRAGAIDFGGLHNLVGDGFKDALHDEDAEGQVQRHVGQDDADQRVGEVEGTLDFEDADKRDDACGKEQGTHQKAEDNYLSWQSEMDQRIAG